MSDKSLEELKAVILSTQALLSHLSSSLKEQASPPSFGDKPTPNALALSSTAAALIKAQTTKLSLLVVNKPFTASAISGLLKTVASECMPALAAGVQVAGSSARYPKAVRKDLTHQTSSLLLEFGQLLREIPVDERGVSAQQSRGRDLFANTGVIWAACDAIVEVGDKGAAAVVAARAEASHGLVKDAIDELKECVEDVAEDDEEDDDDVSHEDGSSSLNGSDLMGGARCPASMQDLARRAVAVVEHVRLLFPPLVKRRIRKFPPLTAKTKVEELPPEDAVARLDRLADELHGLSEETDEVAGCLYEMDEDRAKEQLAKLGSLAKACADAMVTTWTGDEDELSPWLSTKWRPTLEELLPK